MVTLQQAITANNFTHVSMKNKDNTPLRVRRSGKTKTWKRNQEAFSIPVKYGLYYSTYITEKNASDWDVAG